MGEQIVEEYFEKQKSNPLLLCIYEECDDDLQDKEWFFYNDNWCYFVNKEVYNKEYKENEDVIKLVQKKNKKFSAKHYITEMSFDNFMCLKFCELYNDFEPLESDVNTFIEKYNKYKKENPASNIENFIEKITNDRQKQQEEADKRTKKYTIGCVLILVIPILLILLKIISFIIGIK